MKTKNEKDCISQKKCPNNLIRIEEFLMILRGYSSFSGISVYLCNLFLAYKGYHYFHKLQEQAALSHCVREIPCCTPLNLLLRSHLHCPTISLDSESLSSFVLLSWMYLCSYSYGLASPSVLSTVTHSGWHEFFFALCKQLPWWSQHGVDGFCYETLAHFWALCLLLSITVRL